MYFFHRIHVLELLRCPTCLAPCLYLFYSDSLTCIVFIETCIYFISYKQLGFTATTANCHHRHIWQYFFPCFSFYLLIIRLVYCFYRIRFYFLSILKSSSLILMFYLYCLYKLMIETHGEYRAIAMREKRNSNNYLYLDFNILGFSKKICL